MQGKPNPDVRLIYGQVLDFLSDPGEAEAEGSYRYFPDGALLVLDGRVAACGARATVDAALSPEMRATLICHDYRGQLILPGLVDTHCHFSQAMAMAGYGRTLLEWLNHYAFPAEMAMADEAVAQRTAAYFLERLVAHGTTTASVFATVHAGSVDALMAAADQRRLRLLTGKVMMDRHAPPALCDTLASAERDCLQLIERWHGRGRLRYSITPRFAPTSTPAQLGLAGALYQSRPDLHVQSHLAENHDEIAWVAALFPESRDYLSVYAQHGLLGPRSIYGHCLHLSTEAIAEMAATGTAAAFCPTSNLFLGSGFFNHAAMAEAGVRVGLATDVGGGTSFSLIRTLDEAYKVSQVHRRPLAPFRAWYLATLGGAQALSLGAFIGNFEIGKEADFVVLNPLATPELAFRLSAGASLAETLFALLVLGDERCVTATHIQGCPAHVIASR